MTKWFYGVKNGRKIGVYNSWEECQKQVIGFPNAEFKKFSSEQEALEYVLGTTKKIELRIETLAYVDGSYNLETGSYSYGVVIIDGENEYHFSGREDDKELALMRNVAGEIKGSMVAMEWARINGKKSIGIYYDYTGIENWALGNWKTNKEGTKNYKKYYDKIKNDLDVVFIKVKAHSGNKYNDLADKLAKEAIYHFFILYIIVFQ